MEVLSAKKNLRVLEVLLPERREFKQISGGLLVQKAHEVDAPVIPWRTGRSPRANLPTRILADLEFAWRTVRAAPNAIRQGWGFDRRWHGPGLISCKLAVERANTLGGRSTGDAAQRSGGADYQQAARE